MDAAVIVAIAAPIAGGLAFLAYKHPTQFGPVASKSRWATVGVLLEYFVYRIGFDTGSKPGATPFLDWMTVYIWCGAAFAFMFALDLLTYLGLTDEVLPKESEAGEKQSDA